MANSWTFVAGHYDATYNTVSIGSSKNGFRIRIEYIDREIVVDEYGDGAVDSLQAGCRVSVELDFVEYESIEAALMAQFGGAATQGDIYAQVGKLLSTLGAELVLTPVVRTNNNETYTFFKAIVVDNVPVLLSSGLREGPVTFRVFVNQGTGADKGKYFKQT